MGGRKSRSFCSTGVQVISKSLCHSETQQSDSLVKMPTTFFLEMVTPVTICRHEPKMQQKTPLVGYENKIFFCYIFFKVTVIIRSRAVIENQASPEGFA